MSAETFRPNYKRIAAQVKKHAVSSLRHAHRDPNTYRNLFAEIQSSAKRAQRSRHDPQREWYYATTISGNSYLLASYLEPWIGAEQATALYESVEPIHARCRHLSSLLFDAPAAPPPNAS